MHVLGGRRNSLDQVFQNHADWLDVVHHAGNLPDHHRAHLHVAFPRRHAQRAQAQLFQFFRRSARRLFLEINARELVLEHSGRMPGGTSRNNRGTVAGLQYEILIILMGDTLLGHDEARAHLHRLRAQRERRADAAGIADAAGRDDGNIHRVHYLRHQGHRRQLADMTAALHAFRSDRVHARTDETLRQRHRGHDRDHFRSNLFQ